MDQAAIIIFRKNRIPGQVKTRLASVLGEDKALEIYEKLVERTLKACHGVIAEKFLYYSDFIPEESRQLNGFHFRVQSSGDLGAKMDQALSDIIGEGFSRVLLIGTDCAEMSSEVLNQGLDLLQENEVVLGPAEDGGYYLVGSRKPVPGIFENMTWSTDSVYQETIERLKSLKIKYGVLPVLMDVDVPEDWEKVKEKFN
ncbi:TIGR04282 family arsenosugar biosynthesis glycosyltransferase [Algoriphagus sp. CAU 1675]|uniref:TIGR04282 family arsenosugar biosynthesis glycosyltransferase n=1 Tax=Algoriphagus sp. CAU 1675 TaxID=3032597 RepID=UPI0023DC5CE1|nr:TIGR04282 family arsenosugar biosynthesis glycosyltransferase [Algoriphagus sp. CAU 1675]MDF2158003.1 TIGR04282 family arsenosugar biosynthesis glycosyltransferase [Algoriphagus sp. CAU 1675]